MSDPTTDFGYQQVPAAEKAARVRAKLTPLLLDLAALGRGVALCPRRGSGGQEQHQPDEHEGEPAR